MDLETRKYRFIQELYKVEDEQILEKLELILKANQNDWFDELSDLERIEIQIGLDQAEKGEFTSHGKIFKMALKFV